MADGTRVRAGSVASNRYPLHTRLDVTPAPGGRRIWVVRDHIGWGTQLDFWLPSCWSARQWGRRVVRVRRA
jgi:3D (Asp-Asp-Asp) domain-containing protein